MASKKIFTYGRTFPLFPFRFPFVSVLGETVFGLQKGFGRNRFRYGKENGTEKEKLQIWKKVRKLAVKTSKYGKIG